MNCQIFIIRRSTLPGDDVIVRVRRTEINVFELTKSTLLILRNLLNDINFVNCFSMWLKLVMDCSEVFADRW